MSLVQICECLPSLRAWVYMVGGGGHMALKDSIRASLLSLLIVIGQLPSLTWGRVDISVKHYENRDLSSLYLPPPPPAY